jgi:DNA-binding NtrC family response regulator
VSSELPRVLAVDDDENNIDLLRRSLRGEFNLTTLTSAREALVALEAGGWDLIIVDQRMPEMTGTELLERARVLQPQARRVILSAFAETPALLTAINRCRIHRFLSKPVRPDDLLSCARALAPARKARRQRGLLLDLNVGRGAALAAAFSGTDIELQVVQELDKNATPSLLILVEPKSEAVEATLEALGSERSTMVMVVVAGDAVGDAASYLETGVDEIIWPPARGEEVLWRFRTWQARRAAEIEIERLQGELASKRGYFDIVGDSESMRAIFASAERVAGTDTSVLILGETGTGKELVARAIHAASHRREGPFVAVNLSAIPETLVESEIFGHDAGAFTGAHKARPGRLEAVEGGTLFLDEVGDLPLSVQVKLLRILQERRYSRVGSNDTRSANFRLLCATHRDLPSMISERKFREDLFYRINVLQIELPPLRERREDIALLVNHFLQRFSLRGGKRDVSLSEAAMKELVDYSWPGNVRQLEHAVERAVALARDGEALQPGLVTERHRVSFRGEVDTFMKGGRGLEQLLEDIERTALQETMQRYGGNQTAAAAKLQIPRSTLRNKLRKHGL